MKTSIFIYRVHSCIKEILLRFNVVRLAFGDLNKFLHPYAFIELLSQYYKQYKAEELTTMANSLD